MSTHTRRRRPSLSLVCLAAVLAALAGCATPRAEHSATAGGSAGSAAPSVAAATIHAASPTGGTVSAETATIYRATPVEYDQFELHLATLHAQTMHTFASEDGYRAGSDDWKVTLRFNLRDEHEDRWSRVAGPMRVTSLIDDAGKDHAAYVSAKAHHSSTAVSFLRSTRRGSTSWQSMEMTVTPQQLPRQFRVLQGEIPMEVVSESKIFTLPLTDSREEDLVPGVKVTLRIQPGEGNSAERYRRVNMTIEVADKKLPFVRSVMYTGPDGRSRDVGGMNFEDGADGIRRSTFNLSADFEKGAGTPVIKIDLVLAVTPLTIPFEFRGIPVGAIAK